jgi:hypothetical protein
MSPASAWAWLSTALLGCSSVGPSANANGTPSGPLESGSASASPGGGSTAAGGVNEGGPGQGLPLAGVAGPADCSAPPEPSELVGWASDGTGTTGGGDLEPVRVSTAEEFAAAIDGDEPRVIYLQAAIDGRFEIDSNKTVAGVCGAQITGHIASGPRPTASCAT